MLVELEQVKQSGDLPPNGGDPEVLFTPLMKCYSTSPSSKRQLLCFCIGEVKFFAYEPTHSQKRGWKEASF